MVLAAGMIRIDSIVQQSQNFGHIPLITRIQEFLGSLFDLILLSLFYFLSDKLYDWIMTRLARIVQPCLAILVHSKSRPFTKKYGPNQVKVAVAASYVKGRHTDIVGCGHVRAHVRIPHDEGLCGSEVAIAACHVQRGLTTHGDKVWISTIGEERTDNCTIVCNVDTVEWRYMVYADMVRIDSTLQQAYNVSHNPSVASIQKFVSILFNLPTILTDFTRLSGASACFTDVFEIGADFPV
jgi:hypothetical protein